jgi:hypothetical protein
MNNTLTNPLKNDQPNDLPDLIDNAFGHSGVRAQAIQNAMGYQFNPERKAVEFNGLWLEIVLNRARYDYVRSTLEKTRQSHEIELHSHSNPSKLSLRPHMPPPGSSVCQFCDLESKPLFITRLVLRDKNYGLVVNPRPWGHRNFMLITHDPDPQAMSRENLRNSFELIRMLSSDYEGIFTGVQAGASVYHFHLQIHRGSAAIWKNLELRNIRLQPIFSAASVMVSHVEGWPACVFAFEGSNLESLAEIVSCMIETFAKGTNDFPYNIGFRREGEVIRLLLFPRTGEEQPPCMMGHPDSWGRFGFLELGGSVFLLTPEAYKAISESGNEIYEAIARMSISSLERTKLISDFQTSASHLL